MYCPSCGKQIPDQSRFCFECGAAVPTQTSQPAAAPKVTEWEYCYYVQWWHLGKGGNYSQDEGKTEMQARLFYWSHHQKKFLPEIQEYLDQGWEAITEIGPNAYSFRDHSDNTNHWVEARDFRVKFRRPKTQNTPNHLAALLGRWESVEIMKQGLIAGLKVGIASSLGLYANGDVYEFHDDYRYEEFKRGETKRGWGIFDFFNNNQKFAIISDKPSQINYHVIVAEVTKPKEFILQTADSGIQVRYQKIK